MTKLTALIEAAKAANVFCNKCGYMGPDEPTHQGCDYMAKRTAVVPADTILELCELLAQAEKALETCHERSHHEDYDLVTTHHFHKVLTQEALAAIKQWKESKE